MHSNPTHLPVPSHLLSLPLQPLPKSKPNLTEKLKIKPNKTNQSRKERNKTKQETEQKNPVVEALVWPQCSLL